MPNLEDPSDLLSEERLVVRDPRLWWRQPLPWALDFVHPVTFPDHLFPRRHRRVVPGSGRRFPARSPAGFSSASISLLDGTSPLRRGGVMGLALRTVAGNDTATLEGMDAEFPTIGFRLDGATSHVRPQTRRTDSTRRAEAPFHRRQIATAACASSSPQRCRCRVPSCWVFTATYRFRCRSTADLQSTTRRHRRSPTSLRAPARSAARPGLSESRLPGSGGGPRDRVAVAAASAPTLGANRIVAAHTARVIRGPAQPRGALCRGILAAHHGHSGDRR